MREQRFFSSALRSDVGFVESLRACGADRVDCGLETAAPLASQHFELSAAVESAAAADADARSAIFTKQFSAPRRKLPRVQRLFPKPLAPIRNERAMRRARDGIFRDARCGGKES